MLVKLSTKQARKRRAKDLFGEIGIPRKLLNINNTYKTAKGLDLDVSTAILYLAPYDESGVNLCPKASKGCARSCLYTAGHGSMDVVERARLSKTHYYLRKNAEFMLHLEKDIAAFRRNAKRRGLVPCVRLNGTSDIHWERKGFFGADGQWYESMMHRFPDLQFYDYTKFTPEERPGVAELNNYHVTFSRAEDNHDRAMEALDGGWNVAVVFRKHLPETWHGVPVLDGDVSDVRFYDKPGHIVGLKAKGQARKDTSGFVVDGGER